MLLVLSHQVLTLHWAKKFSWFGYVLCSYACDFYYLHLSRGIWLLLESIFKNGWMGSSIGSVGFHLWTTCWNQCLELCEIQWGMWVDRTSCASVICNRREANACGVSPLERETFRAWFFTNLQWSENLKAFCIHRE